RNGAPARCEVERAGYGEERIAQGLDIKPAPRGAPEQAVLGVDGRGALRGRGRLLIGGREEDLAVQSLQRPVLLHQECGQVVEQLRVARAVPERAEIRGSADDPLAEVVLPDAVRDDARGERIETVGNGLGQLQAACPTGERLRRAVA